MEKKKLPGENVALVGLGVLVVAVLAIISLPVLKWWVIPGMVIVAIVSLQALLFLAKVVWAFFDSLGWDTFGWLVGFPLFIGVFPGTYWLTLAYMRWAMQV